LNLAAKIGRICEVACIFPSVSGILCAATKEREALKPASRENKKRPHPGEIKKKLRDEDY
jgi:hypothetical protein